MGDLWTANVYNLYKTLLLVDYSPFQANVLFPWPLKTSENLRFSYALREWGKDHLFEMG